MEVERKRFQGVFNILSFNRHFYFMGLGVWVALAIIHHLAQWPPLVLWIINAAFVYGLMMPLIVSAYVYDFSGYYDFHWLKSLTHNEEKPRVIVNINAGFDETSFILKSKLPESDLSVFDFYNAKQHTEPAIVRARKVSRVYPNTQHIATNAIPLSDSTVDLIFLLSAVHEIRSHEEKVQFFKECHRLCKPNGRVIMVEHLRDFPNFLAFSIGFTHFFSRSVWRNVIEQAGFMSFQETKFTPFMSIFTCCK